METIKLRETDEFIKLGQALKAAGLVESGVEAKEVIPVSYKHPTLPPNREVWSCADAV